MRIPVISIIIFGCAAGCFALFHQAENRNAEELERYVIIAEAAEVPVFDKKMDAMVDEKEVAAEHNVLASNGYSSPYNFVSLKEINKDIIGWLKIPGTVIDYPIVFDGTDNYLNKNLDGDYSHLGSIFMDGTSDPMEGFVNIIYGHNMKDGSMFSAINDYCDKDYFFSHQQISIYLPIQELSLKPAATIVGSADASIRNIESIDMLNEFSLDKEIVTGQIPQDAENLYIFITCNYTGKNFRTYLICIKNE